MDTTYEYQEMSGKDRKSWKKILAHEKLPVVQAMYNATSVQARIVQTTIIEERSQDEDEASPTNGEDAQSTKAKAKTRKAGTETTNP